MGDLHFFWKEAIFAFFFVVGVADVIEIIIFYTKKLIKKIKEYKNKKS